MCEKCVKYQNVAKNSLAVQNPELAKEWHPTKNGNMTPFNVLSNSGKKIWWKCKKCDYEWIASIRSRSCGYCNCKKCNSLAIKNPKLAEEWHPTKNKNLTSFDVSSKSDKKVWWICKNKHEWEAQVCSRSNNRGCPYCSGFFPSKENNLAIKNPKLIKEWHPTKNGDLTPENVTPSSAKKVWWICKKGHEWESTVNRRNAGAICPYCSGSLASKENNLAIKHPELIEEWHPTKNENLTPFDMTPYSEKKVWWQCKKGHEWKTMVRNRSYNKDNCPICAETKGEKRIASFLKIKSINFITQKTFDDCISKATKRKLLFDFYLIDKNILIEFDGQGHFWAVKFGGTSYEKALKTFKRTKEHDKIKTKFAKKEGIKLIRIPYTEFKNIEKILTKEFC